MHIAEYEDKEMIKKSIDFLINDEYVTFCIVAQTWGSSPRPPGSLMIITQQGDVLGSVSGGCVEDDIQEKYLHGFFDHKKITRLVYNGRDDDKERVKIPCGSVVEIIVERISDLQQLKTIYDCLCSGGRISRILSIEQNTSSLVEDTCKDKDFYYDGRVLKKTFGSAWCILIIGANHVTSYVITLGKMLGFRLVVCEPRESYRTSWDNKTCEVTSLMPDDAVKYYATDFYTIVLSLSHDPKLDDMALMTALEQDLFYVGAIGSEKNNIKRKKRLKELGLTDASIKKLHGPVGLGIRSKTPAEISVSIFAELIDLKNKLKYPLPKLD